MSDSLPFALTESLADRVHGVLRRHLGFLSEAWLWAQLNDPIRALVADACAIETAKMNAAQKILIDGLAYHEHDGHDLPKRVVREALVALGVPVEDQP